jgi:hypothetical protein
MQHWLVTFTGKSSAGTNSIVLRIRVNNTGDQLEGIFLANQILSSHTMQLPSAHTHPSS